MKLNLTPIAAQLGRCALIATLAGMPLAASANHGDTDFTHPGFYLGGGAGLNSLNGEDYTGSSNDRVEAEKVSYKGFAGFRLNSMISLEAAYIDFGTAEDGGNRVDAHGVVAGGVFEAAMSPHFHPYLKAGALFWDSDSQFSGVSSADDGTDFTYGAGLRFLLGPKVDIRTEYERFEMNFNDVHTISAMLQLNF